MRDIIDVVQAEGRALYAALSIAEGATAFREDIEAFRQNFPLEDSIEGLTKSAALKILCGEPPLENLVASWEVPQNDYEVLCSLWTSWATRGSTLEVPLLQHDFGGCMERLALKQWRSALESLFSEDLQTARKLYRRATLLGSEYGTQSHLTIQWTYAATFLPAA